MKIKSLILFGSQVSGASDCRSDKDLLIICEPKHKNYAINKYSSLDYSVSIYTECQLHFMKERGSLFLQHLKYESQVLMDNQKVFKNFIRKCDFVKPSALEINSAKKTIANTLTLPKEFNDSLWKADYLFVLSRDYFIKYFARKGMIVFNTFKLANAIQEEFALEDCEIDIFLELRKCKSTFRASSVAQIPVKSVILCWQKILVRILKLEIGTLESLESYAFNQAPREFYSRYELLRYIESLRLIFPIANKNQYDENRIVKIIFNPNHYSGTSTKNEKFLLEYLSQLRRRIYEFRNQSQSIDQF